MNTFEYRVGDAERDRAVEQLREHLAAGRLMPEEFTERMSAALQARFISDLRILFVDLPTSWDGTSLAALESAGEVARRGETQGSTLSSPPPGRTTLQKVTLGLNGSLWPLALVVMFATGFSHWWIWLVPMAVSPLLLTLAGDTESDNPADEWTWGNGRCQRGDSAVFTQETRDSRELDTRPLPRLEAILISLPRRQPLQNSLQLRQASSRRRRVRRRARRTLGPRGAPLPLIQCSRSS